MTLNALIEDDLLDYLAAQGVGTEDVDLFLENMPDSPDACIAVRAIGGGSGTPNLNNDQRRSVIQIQVRNIDPVAGKQKVNEICDLLTVVDLTLTYHRVWLCEPAQQEPTLTYYDQQNRAIWTPTFVLTYHRL